MKNLSETQQFSKEEIELFFCPGCGGNMVFDIKNQILKCPHCETELPIDSTGSVQEYSFDEICDSDLSDNWTDEVFSIECRSCGAEVITSQQETTTSCLYCGSSHILQKKQTSGIQPEGVIPFKITKQDADKKFGEWVKKQWLAPNDFKQLYQKSELKGVYVPYWTYDAKTSGVYQCRVGTYYHVTRRHSNGQTVRQRKIKWRRVQGFVSDDFDDVLVGASSNISEVMLRKVEPFDTQKALPYQTEYLSGYIAEHYTLGVKDGFKIAQQRMCESLGQKQEIELLRRYDCVDTMNVIASYEDVTFKHILLPIWIISYHYKDKNYQFLLNGETGKYYGDYPKSKVKIALIVITITLLIVFSPLIFTWLWGVEAWSESLIDNAMGVIN